MMRLCLVMMVVFLCVILLLFTAPSPYRSTGVFNFKYYDYYGHFGSFICGLFLGLIFMRRARRLGRDQPNSIEKLMIKIGAGGMALFTILMVSLWFTVVTPI